MKRIVSFFAVLVCAFSARAAGTAASLQALIDAAEAGATVNVPAGLYLLETSVRVDKAITLAGAGRAAVVLDGQGAVNGLEVTAAGATVKDLTVTNAAGGFVSGASRMGAGIYAVAGTRVENCLVTHCTIETESTDALYGAGIWSAGVVTNCTIRSCTLYKHPATVNNNDCRGAGVYLAGGTLGGSVVTGCVNNAAQGNGEAQNCHAVRGGGVYATDGSTVDGCFLLGNQILNNKTGSSRKDVGMGGGIAAEGASTVIRRTLIRDNRTPSGAAGNIDLSETAPGFRKNSIALKDASPLRDAGRANAWATGVKDLGNGAYRIDPVGTWGVTVRRQKTRERVRDGRLDIGASEYAPVGVIHLVR